MNLRGCVALSIMTIAVNLAEVEAREGCLTIFYEAKDTALK
jgi:hypothetical protein